MKQWRPSGGGGAAKRKRSQTPRAISIHIDVEHVANAKKEQYNRYEQGQQTRQTKWYGTRAKAAPQRRPHFALAHFQVATIVAFVHVNVDNA